MALKIFKNKGESGAIPLNAENLNYNFNEILNLVYPIGRGFIDFTDTDYSNYLGFTWERELVGMTAVGLDTTQTEFNSVGKIGGEKTHKITIEEMETHQHGEFIEYGGGKQAYTLASGGGSIKKGYFLNASTTEYEGPQVLTEKSGGGQPHNNLQPYQVVAYWKRIL